MLIRVLEHHDVDRRRVEGRWNNVVGELTVRHAPIAHDDFLEERIPDTLRAAALDLAGCEHRVDGFSDLVDRRERCRLDLPRIRIDFNLHDVTRPAVAAIGVPAVAVIVPSNR